MEEASFLETNYHKMLSQPTVDEKMSSLNFGDTSTFMSE